MNDGREYPSFLVSHIESEWQDVAADALDPELCLRVDAWLDSAGLECPSSGLRQYVYALKDRDCLDEAMVSTYAQLEQALSDAPAPVADATWLDMLFAEFDKDCGLSEAEYQQRVEQIGSADWSAFDALTA